MIELYECANCFGTVTLNQHGRCQHCDSASVLSVERIDAMILGPGPLEEEVIVGLYF